MFSFDGKCVYEDLRCLCNKAIIPEEKEIGISSNFFLPCNKKTIYDISDVTLWKNIKFVMLNLFFVHDTR